MLKHIYRIALLLLALAVFAGSARAQGTFDMVYRTDRGEALRGTVTGMNNDTVSVDVGGRTQDVSAVDISKITFAGEPLELRSARDQIRVGQYANALQNLNQIQVNTIGRDVIRQDIDFYRALANCRLALQGSGDANQALRDMTGFIGAVRDGGNYHYYEACQVYGDLQLMRGDFERAARVYQELAKAPWPEMKMRSYTLEARARQLAGDYASAAQTYARVISEAPNTADGRLQKQLAVVGQAACMAETGQTDQAITQLQNVITETPADPENAEILAKAYNALGAAYRNSGQTQDAILAYLHVDLLFMNNSDAHAEALYYLSQLWPEVRQTDRAARARDLLRQPRYSSSIWAQKL